ncbi:biotin/lipoyl-binding protein [Paraclostridium ghonii]|uniref:Biotin carboxyl carrier protein n=1 Tax=Paraclostridium ghonii TaxID=29358 RepID=A0ABU0N1A0_9FIRM|nr:biotin/lipoyl-containing protein [Paeniclostridium ghonii]MDQ0556930.1 biotin carboxyl carrier protein [Paeniclostridium ghonii]
MSAKTYNITLNGKVYEVEIEEVKKGEKPQPTIQKQAPQPKKEATGSGETIEAPMPGTIVNVMVKNGEQVKKGQVVAILEAMKMENEIVSPVDGRVVSVDVEKGQNVNLGDSLVQIG